MGQSGSKTERLPGDSTPNYLRRISQASLNTLVSKSHSPKGRWDGSYQPKTSPWVYNSRASVHTTTFVQENEFHGSTTVSDCPIGDSKSKPEFTDPYLSEDDITAEMTTFMQSLPSLITSVNYKSHRENNNQPVIPYATPEQSIKSRSMSMDEFDRMKQSSFMDNSIQISSHGGSDSATLNIKPPFVPNLHKAIHSEVSSLLNSPLSIRKNEKACSVGNFGDTMQRLFSENMFKAMNDDQDEMQLKLKMIIDQFEMVSDRKIQLHHEVKRIKDDKKYLKDVTFDLANDISQFQQHIQKVRRILNQKECNIMALECNPICINCTNNTSMKQNVHKDNCNSAPMTLSMEFNAYCNSLESGSISHIPFPL